MINNNIDNHRVIFSTKFNLRGPNVTKIIKGNFYLLENFERVISRKKYSCGKQKG